VRSGVKEKKKKKKKLRWEIGSPDPEKQAAGALGRGAAEPWGERKNKIKYVPPG
jgi:hypothetical protein